MNNNLTEPYVSTGQLNIPAGIFFTRQPQRAAASGPDQTAVFKVTAINAVSYQWQCNDGSGWTDIDGAESDTFETVIGPSMHGWKFRCVVEDADGASAASSAAAITVSNTSRITLSGAVATIDYGPVNIYSLVVDIDAVQSGTGDPSPDNIRPISGWNSVEVVVSPTLDAEDGRTYPISLGQTVYGGVLDVVSGVLTLTHYMQTAPTTGWEALTSPTRYRIVVPRSYAPATGYSASIKCICNMCKITNSKSYSTDYNNGEGGWYNSTGNFAIRWDEITTLAEWEALLAVTPLTLCYELATPQTITLTPTEVTTLLGSNNIFLADSGEVEVIYQGWPNAE